MEALGEAGVGKASPVRSLSSRITKLAHRMTRCAFLLGRPHQQTNTHTKGTTMNTNDNNTTPSTDVVSELSDFPTIGDLHRALGEKIAENNTLLDNEQVLNERIAKMQEELTAAYRTMGDIRNKVSEFFTNEFDGGEARVVIDREEANDLLESIGADTLECDYEVTLTVSIRMTVQAKSEDDAETIAIDALRIEAAYGHDAEVDEWETDSVDVCKA